MPTDYILFNHGVNNRSVRPEPTYADALFDLIQDHYYQSPGRSLKKIVLYWGDVNKDEEQHLLAAYQASPIWKHLWFQSFREMQLMQFVGDGALYLSRYAGARVADRLMEQALTGLQGYQPQEDRLHLVTHSMGTIILFDMLFSARWDPNSVPGHTSVAAMRQALFGVAPHPTQGIRLGSISTMGSPIGFFSLTDVDNGVQDAIDANGTILSTHDITPRMEQMLASLHQVLGQKLPWYNFVHPGDPVAYPLEKLLAQLIDQEHKYIQAQDILTRLTSLTDILIDPLSQTLLALLHGGEAHHSYWTNEQVAQRIAQAIQITASDVGTDVARPLPT